VTVPNDKPVVDMVNSPPHYTRGPKVGFTGGWIPGGEAERVLECIEVIRHIDDFRLATAIKYLWRIAFGGKFDNAEDAKKAIWYIQDYIDHPPEGTLDKPD
jgi:hypothetical protein